VHTCAHPVITLNLLILRNGRNAKSSQNAILRYTAGTRIRVLSLVRTGGPAGPRGSLSASMQ